MEQEVTIRQKISLEYHDAVEPLLVYLSWLEKHSGTESFTVYGGEGVKEHSLSFPIYDPTLIKLVKQAEKSSLMDRNYRYVYTRNRLDTHEAERSMIQKATYKDWGILKGIFSRYVMGGRTKAYLWSEAVKENIFYLVLLRMREIVEQWEKPSDPVLGGLK